MKFKAVLLITLLALTRSVVAEESASLEKPQAVAAAVNELEAGGQLTLTGVDAMPNEERWFWHLGVTSAFPKIDSEKLIQNLYDPIMQAIAPGIHDVRLIGDYRDFGLLLAPQIGLGRRIGDHLTLTFHTGWAGGHVRTKQNERSWILLLPFHSDFEIHRAAAYADFAVDIYPWGHPKLLDYETWRERFRAARPKVAFSTTFTNASYKAQVRFGLAQKYLPNFGIALTDEWSLQSYKPRIGLEVPINRRNVVSFDVAYNFFEDLQYDFNGPILNLIWQHYWKP